MKLVQDSHLNSKVIAAKNVQEYYVEQERVVVFFSLVVTFPVFAVILVLIGVFGVFPYIRSHINNEENFPRIAAFYWIGQTFTLWVIIMDIQALLENSIIHHQHNGLKVYQVIFLCLVIIVEILCLVLSFLLALVPLFSHYKGTHCKDIFESYFHFVCCRNLSFKKIGRKEARVWLIASSMIAPIIAISCHAGFIIGGSVSYTSRSAAIFCSISLSLCFFIGHCSICTCFRFM